ncbi:MAG TPA: ATP-binding protein, partial [Acidimicrobiia bacterium]
VRFGGPNVSVTATRSGPDIAIAVRDDGPAVPDSEIERMFSSDLRHGRPVTRPATVGLSLSVGRHLARRMEGDIVYRRTADGENLYELRLPSERVDRMFDRADELDISA